MLASGSNDQSVRVWDIASGECKADLRGHDHVVECVVFVPVNAYEYLRELVGYQGMVVASPTPDGKPLNSSKQVKVAAQAPGQYVVSGSRDKTLKLFDVATQQLLHTFNGHDNWVRGITFHPNGRYFLSVSDDKTLKIWDLKTGRNTKTMDAHTHFCTCVSFCQISPVVATGGVDQVAKIWECR